MKGNLRFCSLVIPSACQPREFGFGSPLTTHSFKSGETKDQKNRSSIKLMQVKWNQC